MKRRDRDTPHHPHNSLKRHRRQRRRRRLQSLLLASAALVVPAQGAHPLVQRPVAGPEARMLVDTPLIAEVTTDAVFSLPAAIAYEGLIQEAAVRFSLAPALIRAVIRTESAFDASAVSSAGAQGLMQLMPALASEMGVADPFDPRENIMAGSEYLSGLLGENGGDVELALASYNAGPAAVDRYQGMPPFEETRRYVRTILDLMARGDAAPDGSPR